MKPNKVRNSLSKLAICGVIVVQLGLPVVAKGQTNPTNFVAQTSIAQQQQLAEAEQLIQQAFQLYKQGKYADAIPLAQQGLAIFEKVNGPEHPDVGSSLNILALLYESQGNYTEAEPLYLRALAILEKVLGPEHPRVGSSLNNLALLYQSQGNYTEAESLIKRSLAIDEKVNGPEHSRVATSLNNLAELYRVQGNYTEAEPLYLRSLAIREKVNGPEHPSVASSLNNLALLYKTQGNYTEAEPLIKRALAIFEKVNGPEHQLVATSLNNLAALYDDQGNYTEAEPLYLRSLAILEKVLGPEHPRVASSLNNLAELYRAQGNYTEAEPLYLRSLAIHQKALGPEHPDVALDLNNLAGLYYFQGNYTEAEPLFLRSLAIREKVLGPEHPRVAISLNNLSMLYWGQDNFPRTIELLTRGTVIEEKRLNTFLTTTGDSARKHSYIKTLSGSTYWTISLHLHSAPKNLEAAQLALTTILRRKGRILDALSDTVATLRKRLNPEDKTLLDKLASQRTRLASLTFQGAGDTPPQEYQILITILERNIKELEATLSQHSATFRTESQPITIEAVQQLIPSDAALIEFILYFPFNPKAAKQDEKWGKPRYAAYILHPSGEPKAIDLGEAETIDKEIKTFRSLISSPPPRKSSLRLNSLKNIQKSSHLLYQLLIQPIRAILGSTHTLLIAPDSQLNIIPFAALVDENGTYLIENYFITYLTSGRDLLKLQNKVPPRSNSVIVANPDYQATSVLIASATRGAERARVDLTKLSWCCEPLPYTAEEAAAIQPFLPAARLFTSSQATVDAVKEATAPDILHLATHGFFLKDQARDIPSTLGDIQDTSIRGENPLLRSGLALAGFNPSQGKFSGALTALEAASLDLWGTKLVVLSACGTGLGDVNNGEGVYGLRRAFVLAGAESLLMSLWDVADEGTSELMVNYYSRLVNGMGRSEALRQTQLEMLKSEEYQHPFFWAAFIASGDWRSMGNSLGVTNKPTDSVTTPSEAIPSETVPSETVPSQTVPSQTSPTEEVVPFW